MNLSKLFFLRITALLVAVTYILFSCESIADPLNGFSLNAGGVSNNMAATLVSGGGSYNYSSAGLSLGIDYQMMVSPTVSFNPFLMSSSESATGAVTQGTSAGHGIFGLQLRYWLGDLFLGAHIADYSEVLINSSNNPTSTSGSGFGEGLVFGWEPSNTKWYWMGQFDSAKIKYSDANVNLSGFRLSIGYRWK